VFTGDSVYADRIDAVKLPQQDDRQLRLSIKKHIDLLTSDVQIFPGHGSTVNGKDLLNQNKELFSFLESVGAAGE
jgi:glyoxylase-like metal-dependent hydrolase (beta-lactamase superfamily II)